MRNCIFICLGGRKSSRKQITIPLKDQNHGAYEIIKPIKEINVEGENTKVVGEKTKEPIVNTRREKLDHHQDQVTKEGTKCDFEDKNIKSESSFKKKNSKKQEPEQNRIQNHQAHSDSSSISSLFSYPISNRYKNNSSTGEESDTNDDHGFVQQESSDSLFSISVNSKKQIEPGEKEVNSPLKVCKLPEKEIETIGSNYCLKINSITKPIKNVTQSIMDDEQDNKENIKSNHEIVGLNHGAKICSVLNPIENLKVPFSCQESSFKSSLKFSETKAKEVLVDTSLSSWLAESERERDGPKSVKNSPGRGNDNHQIEKDKPTLIPQARTRRLRV